jgi:hypothetical protein
VLACSRAEWEEGNQIARWPVMCSPRMRVWTSWVPS